MQSKQIRKTSFSRIHLFTPFSLLFSLPRPSPQSTQRIPSAHIVGTATAHARPQRHRALPRPHVGNAVHAAQPQQAQQRFASPDRSAYSQHCASPPPLRHLLPPALFNVIIARPQIPSLAPASEALPVDHVLGALDRRALTCITAVQAKAHVLAPRRRRFELRR